MPLSDVQIRSAQTRDRDWKLADEKGLYLLISRAGSKLWRFKFRVHGKEKKLSLGAYPEVTLRQARIMRDDARRDIADGLDPARLKQERKVEASISSANSFKVVAVEYLEKRRSEGLADATISKGFWLLRQLEPTIGKLPVAEIDPRTLLLALRKVEGSGKRETANRMRSFASRVFRYAIATARANGDPAAALRGALASPIVKHHAAITNSVEFGRLLWAIDGYSGEPATIIALRLTPHVFQRPGEIRQMRWKELDLANAVWTLPAPRMKTRREPHSVPLSRQSLKLVSHMNALSSHSEFVFPSIRSRHRPMSENTINGALRRLGYSGTEMTAHGFRATASSLLNESGNWNPDAIERASSHTDRSQIRGIYNRSPYWSERVEMAQWWSDYLDRLRDGSVMTPEQARMSPDSWGLRGARG